jgi:hypothetical protein
MHRTQSTPENSVDRNVAVGQSRRFHKWKASASLRNRTQIQGVGSELPVVAQSAPFRHSWGPVSVSIHGMQTFGADIGSSFGQKIETTERMEAVRPLQSCRSA